MKPVTWKRMAVGVLFAMTGAIFLSAQQAAPDLILMNGKIITVDDRFSIAQALAVRGDRIVAVGTNQEITRLAGPNTRQIDLKRRSVTPGFIDNHAHLMEEGAFWALELRLDGVESRKQALEMVRARARADGPGKWVFTLGGWSTDQFTDNKKPFAREELDQVAPNNPVLLQFTRSQTFLNSKAIEVLGLERITEPWAKYIVRDPGGRPTGVVERDGADPLTRIAKLKEAPKEIFESSSMAMLRELNRVGLTAIGGGCPYLDAYRQWAREGRLNVRFFCMATAPGAGGGGLSSPEQVNKILPEIPKLKLYQGNNYVDQVVWGERLYRIDDTVTDLKSNSKPDDFVQWGRVAREVAKAGLPILIHSTLEDTIEQQLRQVELVNKEVPVRNLRWTFIHLEQITPGQIERMKKLGMYLGVHPRATISGALYHRVHGDRSYEMPPLKAIQDSGIMWGFGTDTTEVNQYRPFTTLWWAVTGKMVGGTIVSHQTISREDALIAHTRKNAFLVWRENDLGSIQPGKLADLVVIDRDYLTVAADQIKDIKPVMTMVGGKVVYDAATESPATR